MALLAFVEGKDNTDSVLKCTSFNSVCLVIIVLILTLCAYSRFNRLGVLQYSVQRIEKGFAGAGSREQSSSLISVNSL